MISKEKSALLVYFHFYEMFTERFARWGSRQTQGENTEYEASFGLSTSLVHQRGRRAWGIFCIWFPPCNITVHGLSSVFWGQCNRSSKDWVSLADINCFTWGDDTWNVIKLQVPSGTIQCNDVLGSIWRSCWWQCCWKGTHSDWKCFLFLYCLQPLRLLPNTDAQAWGAAYESLLLFWQVLLGRSGAAQMWK